MNLAEVQQCCSGIMLLSVEALRSRNKTRALARQRQLVMTVCRAVTGESYRDIGRSMGRRASQAVHFAVNAVADRCAKSARYAAHVSAVFAQVECDLHARRTAELNSTPSVLPPVALLPRPLPRIEPCPSRRIWVP